MTDPALPSSPVASDSNDKLFIILCHVSLLLGVGLLLPLIVFLVKRQESPVVVAHAKETLNFHISVMIYGTLSFFLCVILIGFPMLLALVIGAVVCSIIGAVRASEGGFYRYPLTLRLVS